MCIDATLRAMDWHVVAGIIAGVLAAAAAYPYLRDMLRGETRPNIVSWSIWALAVGISAVAQLSAEPSWSAALVVVTFIVDIIILLFGIFGYGYPKFEWWDGVCLVLSLVALVLWQLSGNPLIALGFAISSDALAFIPTYIKAYRDPQTETPITWVLFGLSGMAAIGAAAVFDFASIGFALYYTIACLGVAGTVILRKD